MRKAYDVSYCVSTNTWEIEKSYLAVAINFHVEHFFSPCGNTSNYKTSVWADTKEEALQKSMEKIQPFTVAISIEKRPSQKEAQHALKKQQLRQLVIFQK